jgi:diphosphoinositol-polyphosphate diphosphatase
MSVKPESDRTHQRYEDDTKTVRLCVGAIPIDFSRGLICLINNIEKEKGGFLIPKGGWEMGETSVEGAKREVLEEAGVRAWVFIAICVFYLI